MSPTKDLIPYYFTLTLLFLCVVNGVSNIEVKYCFPLFHPPPPVKLNVSIQIILLPTSKLVQLALQVLLWEKV